MIDFHTHILPGIDDGARDIDEGIKLADSLYDQGVAVAVCTPHFYPYRMSIDDFANIRDMAMNSMKNVKIKLIPASETYVHEYLFNYNNIDTLTIGNTNYLLLELPFGKKWSSNIFENIERIMNHYNIIPIIAHIEIYPAAKKKDIIKLKELGCVMQLNTSSLLNRKLKRKAIRLIKAGFIDVLGSDCHNLKERSPQIKVALKLIKKKLGSNYIDNLIKKSEMIIEGIDIR